MTSYLIGVQWANSGLSVAALARSGTGKISLLNVSELQFSSEKIAGRGAAFRQWKKAHIPAHAHVQAVLALPESQIIFKQLELPALKVQELSEAVHWELSDSAPLTDAEIQWQVVERTKTSTRVSAMIMKKKDVAEYVSFFDDAGVELVAIEPASLCAVRVMTIPDKTSILLSMEGADVSVVFLTHHVPTFSTSFTLPFTASAQASRHLSRDAASSLVSQIKKVLAYWDTKESTRIEKIIVSSEAALYTGLKSDVARALPVPLEVGQVRRLFGASKPLGSGSLTQHAASLGAAMRLASPAAETVNFLPKTATEGIEKKALVSYVSESLSQFTRINLLVLSVLVLLYGFLLYRHSAYAREIAQTKQFVANHPAQQYVGHVASANTLAQTVEDLMAAQEDVGARLAYLSTATPPRLHYSTIKMAKGSNQEWLVTGTGDRADILAFYYKLLSEANAKEVGMPYSNFDRETGSPFQLTIVW